MAPGSIARNRHGGGSGTDPIVLLAISMLSVQLGGAVAAGLIDDVGVASTVAFRQGGAAVVLLVACRPTLRHRTRSELATIGAFGVVLAGMNSSFYAAIERLPLGVAVTIELIGPLALAATLSRRRNHFVAVAVAMSGVAILGGGGHLDPIGVGFAVLAAAGWATYILLSRSAGQHSGGLDALAIAMAVAATLVAPFGGTSGLVPLEPSIVARGLVVAVLAALVPFSLELIALRTVPARVFGVLMSLSPLVATVVGFVLLGQDVSALDTVAMALIVAASTLVVRSDGRPPSEPAGLGTRSPDGSVLAG